MPVREARARSSSGSALAEHVPHRGARVSAALDRRPARHVRGAARARDRSPCATPRSASASDDARAAPSSSPGTLRALPQRRRPARPRAARRSSTSRSTRRPASQWLPRLIRPLWENSERYRIASLVRGSLGRRRRAPAILDACARATPTRPSTRSARTRAHARTSSPVARAAAVRRRRAGLSRSCARPRGSGCGARADASERCRLGLVALRTCPGAGPRTCPPRTCPTAAGAPRRGPRNSSSLTSRRSRSPSSFTAASRSRRSSSSSSSPELLRLDPDRVEAALLAEHDAARRRRRARTSTARSRAGRGTGSRRRRSRGGRGSRRRAASTARARSRTARARARETRAHAVEPQVRLDAVERVAARARPRRCSRCRRARPSR